MFFKGSFQPKPFFYFMISKVDLTFRSDQTISVKEHEDLGCGSTHM